MPVSDNMLNEYTSTITDWLHMKPLKPINMPDTKPLTRQIQFSSRRSMPFKCATLSMNMLLPRETISAIRPQAMAPAKAEDTPTRQAMFEKGMILVKNQV